MISIQDIFLEYGRLYREKYTSHLNQLKVMSAVESCRTSSLGAHKHTCDEYGYEVISYNSCRNRHCPQWWISTKSKTLHPDKKEVFCPCKGSRQKISWQVSFSS